MPTNSTNLARLARALAASDDLPYQEALRRVRHAASQGLLPTPLNAANRSAALAAVNRLLYSDPTQVIHDPPPTTPTPPEDPIAKIRDAPSSLPLLSPALSRINHIAAQRTPILTDQLGCPPTLDELRADLLERCLEWANSRIADTQHMLPPDQRQQICVAKLQKQGLLKAISSLAAIPPPP
jgi:hypothetical protein